MKKKNIGSSFDSWLREEGIYEVVTTSALKRVLAASLPSPRRAEDCRRSE